MGKKRICLNTIVVMVAILGFIHNSYCAINDVKMFKCCPQGSQLNEISDDSGLGTKYNCTDGEDNSTFFGYNLDVTNDSHIPECLGVELFDFDKDGGLISSDGCIDMYNGALHGLKCVDQPQVEVHILFKCCAEGFIYDISNRQCVDNMEATPNFSNLFEKSVAVLQTHVPVCENLDEIFVEYERNIDELTMIRSGLKLSGVDSDILPPETFCIEELVDLKRNETETEEKHMMIVRTCRPRQMCQKIPCVRRCCSNEKMLQRINDRSACVDYERNIKPIFYDMDTPLTGNLTDYKIVEPAVYGLINTQTCDKYKLSNDNPDDAYFISHVDGSLRVRAFDESFSNNNYCIEFVNTGTIDIHAFVCFSHYSQEKFKYYAPGLAVSCVFLAVTLICYACLPKLLNLHGKTLVCYVISLLSACISLSYVQFHTETKIEHCYFIAYFIFFGFMAAFCWQSIMCFDIWWTFGSVRTSRGMLRNKELRRFLFYSLYAWGVSAMLTTLTYLVDYYHLVPDEWSPRIGSKNVCWFQREDWRGHFIFFLFPVGLHVLTNIILFTLTAIHCNRIKSEISRMQCKDNESEDKKKRFLADKAKYMMNVKLFVVMGVTWMLEVLATLIMSPEELWYVSDYFNILQGVFVFIIFVCKAKVWEAIKQRLGRGTKKTKGPTTVTTQLSVTSNGKLGKSASTSTLSTSNTNLNVIRRAV